MALIKVAPNQGAINQGLASMKDGDTLYVSGGTCLMTSAFAAQFAASNAKLICDGDVTLRMVLKPLGVGANSVVVQRIAAMVALGYSGDVRKLTAAQMAAVNAKIAAGGLDYAGAAAKMNAFLATLSPLTDSRMFGVNLVRNGDATINGINVQWGIGWGSGIAKGMLNTKMGAINQVIEGFTWENGRQEGSSYNGSGIRAYTKGLIIRRNKFRDCEDGVLAGDQSIANPGGDWYAQQMSHGRMDMYGYLADVYCEYDNCGAGGNAHGRYVSPTLWNLSAYAHVIRTKDGNALKFHGDGVSVAFAANVEDATDTDGLLQALDFDCGPSYAINCDVTKATAGGGNYQAPILFRNDREPIASWSEPRSVAVGNVVTYLLPHANVGFVRAVNASSYFGDGTGHDMWPGTPVPMTGIVRSNVFRCAPLVGKLQTQVPANFDVGDNVLIDLNAPIPNKRISLPNYDFSDDSKVISNFVEIIGTADPAVTKTWLPRLSAAKLFPGASPAPAPAPAPSPSPTPAPSPEVDPMDAVLAQQVKDLAAANKQLTDNNATLSQQISDLTALVGTLQGQISDQGNQIGVLTQANDMLKQGASELGQQLSDLSNTNGKLVNEIQQAKGMLKAVADWANS